MKGFILAVLLVATAACLEPFDVTVGVELITPLCRTPIPIYTSDQLAAADSSYIGCPYAYIDSFGDTIIVTTSG